MEERTFNITHSNGTSLKQIKLHGLFHYTWSSAGSKSIKCLHEGLHQRKWNSLKKNTMIPTLPNFVFASIIVVFWTTIDLQSQLLSHLVLQKDYIFHQSSASRNTCNLTILRSCVIVIYCVSEGLNNTIKSTGWCFHQPYCWYVWPNFKSPN